MKARGENETDAQYIRRLEAANADLRKNYAWMSKTHTRLYNVILPCAQQAGVVLQYAAEVCGMKDDPVVQHSIAALKKLGECTWATETDTITMPVLPQLKEPNPERFGGDVEMILKSALEKAKSFRGPFEDTEHLMPKIRELDEDADWEIIRDEIMDALQDLEFNRSMLRLDLRSTMYDYCFRRIWQAISAGYRRSERANPYPPAFSITTLGGVPDEDDNPF